MMIRVGSGVVAAALMLSVAACGGTTPAESENASAPAADASHEEHTGASRVFFVEPKDGATIGPDAKIVFGSEMYTIAAVPPGEVTSVRPGTGHYHLGVDTDCLPAGQNRLSRGQRLMQTLSLLLRLAHRQRGKLFVCLIEKGLMFSNEAGESADRILVLPDAFQNLVTLVGAALSPSRSKFALLSGPVQLGLSLGKLSRRFGFQTC